MVVPVEFEAKIRRREISLYIKAIMEHDAGSDKYRYPGWNVRQEQTENRPGMDQGINNADPQ